MVPASGARSMSKPFAMSFPGAGDFCETQIPRFARNDNQKRFFSKLSGNEPEISRRRRSGEAKKLIRTPIPQAVRTADGSIGLDVVGSGKGQSSNGRHA